MSHFIRDNITKVDRRPIPPGASEVNFVTATDLNDIQDWIRGGDWYGLAAQAADPVPSGVTNYIWLKTDGTLWKTVNSVATQIGAGGGITNGAGANVIPKSDGTNLVASSLGDNGTTFTINTNKFTVTEASGNTAIAGTLGVTGDVAVNTSKFTVTASNGNTLAAGAVTLGTSGAGQTHTQYGSINLNSGGLGTTTVAGNFIVNSGAAVTIGSAATFSNNNTTTFSGPIRVGTSGPTISSGTGSPEGSLTAAVGSLYLRTDGGASTTLYVKESGAGNTGWVAK